MSFALLNQHSKQGFNQHIKLVKALSQGKKVQCDSCGAVISLRLVNNNAQAAVSCKQGCTDILLDLN